MRVNLLVPCAKEVSDLRDRVNSALSELVVRLRGVDEIAVINGTSTATYTTVAHTLGKVPTFVHIEPKAQVAWWVTDADRANWTKTAIYLHFDTASVNFTGYVSSLEE